MLNLISEMSPLDYVYGSMDCKIRRMDESEIDAQYILKYIHNTQIDRSSCKYKLNLNFSTIF